MRSSRFSSDVSIDNVINQVQTSVQPETNPRDGYQWTALSVTTVGALLASIQGIGSPDSIAPHTD